MQRLSVLRDGKMYSQMTSMPTRTATGPSVIHKDEYGAQEQYIVQSCNQQFGTNIGNAFHALFLTESRDS